MYTPVLVATLPLHWLKMANLSPTYMLPTQIGRHCLRSEEFTEKPSSVPLVTSVISHPHKIGTLLVRPVCKEALRMQLL